MTPVAVMFLKIDKGTMAACREGSSVDRGWAARRARVQRTQGNLCLDPDEESKDTKAKNERLRGGLRLSTHRSRSWFTATHQNDRDGVPSILRSSPVVRMISGLASSAPRTNADVRTSAPGDGDQQRDAAGQDQQRAKVVDLLCLISPRSCHAPQGEYEDDDDDAEGSQWLWQGRHVRVS